MAVASDPRYIVLTETGAVSTLGRAEPTADDLARAVEALERQGMHGWLAIASHSFQSRIRPTVKCVSVLRDPSETFAGAIMRAGGKYGGDA